ncbi:hypothetical protein LEP1GSC172_2521 [Leptospira noguchii]|uniref:Uncharacterized protein n=1 Tax=Leptospira noguchii TaxID=28182 RepID=M6V2Z0_9LEPT|nr:hypothetical protein LEP1GSC172_2521 [Leptospira noguchii]
MKRVGSLRFQERFQSTSFTNKGRNTEIQMTAVVAKCFNPLPSQTKEEICGGIPLPVQV